MTVYVGASREFRRLYWGFRVCCAHAHIYFRSLPALSGSPRSLAPSRRSSPPRSGHTHPREDQRIRITSGHAGRLFLPYFACAVSLTPPSGPPRDRSWSQAFHFIGLSKGWIDGPTAFRPATGRCAVYIRMTLAHSGCPTTRSMPRGTSAAIATTRSPF